MSKQVINILTGSHNLKDDALTPSNQNFDQLFRVPGGNIQRFLSKLRDNNTFWQGKTIRISVIGDSITNYWAGTYLWIEDYIESLYPEKTFEYKHIQLGGTGSEYHLMAIDRVIGFNPDLIIYGEWEGTARLQLMEKTLELLRDQTSADIAIFPFTLNGTSCNYLYNNNITGYLASDDYKMRCSFWSLAQKYNCAIWDFSETWIYPLINQQITPGELLRDSVHPSDYGISLWEPVLSGHLNTQYVNPENINQNTGKIDSVSYFRELIHTPDKTKLTKSGTWAASLKNTDHTYYSLDSSDAGAFVVKSIKNAIGFELTYFGGAVGEIGIKIDAGAGFVDPSTLIKDYADCYTGYLSRPYKVIINSNLLADSETERRFRFTIGTIVRNGSNIITSAPYTLTDVTKSVTVGNGDFNADSTFSYDGGSITIPSQYCGYSNLREYTLLDIPAVVGNIFDFYVKKNWQNTVSVTANNLTNVVRIFGLTRGDYTIKIICNSGTISLDSIMELK